MKNFALLAGLLALVAGAWAADMAVDKAPPELSNNGPANDATVELSWDSGSSSYGIAWYTGAGTWVGNDFNISTVKSYPYIRTMRIFTYPNWPNGAWDGFRVGVYSFSGGVPGSLLWGPEWYVPTGGQGWKDIDVGWLLPSGVKAFVPAMEQYYNYPNCDPHLVDNNPTFLNHSWVYYGGTWSPNSNSTPYYNIMLRVIVDNENNPAVAPSSIGRVKALYF
jgi:hypothetical protein